MSEELRKLGTEHLFVDAVAAAKQGNFLGDALVVETLLRLALSRVGTQFGPGSTVESRKTVLDREQDEFASILLGKRKTFVPLPKWNAPGYIDVFLSRHIGSAETDPDMVLKHAFVKTVREMQALGAMASVPGIHEEQVRFQIDDMVLRWVTLLMGIDPASYALMELSDNEPQTDDPERD